MHEYYLANLAKYHKTMINYLSPIKNELEETMNLSFDEIIDASFKIYKEEMLERFPYIGGDKVSGTNNLVGAYMFIALGELMTRNGIKLETWGYLTTLAYRRYFNKIPKFITKLGPQLLKHPKFVLKMLKKKDQQNASNVQINPGSFETKVISDDPNYDVVYLNLVCPLSNFAKTYGYEKYMPYICNLDYVTFKIFNLPFYRTKTCFKGDEYCDFKFKLGAKINDDWPCHYFDSSDDLN